MPRVYKTVAEVVGDLETMFAGMKKNGRKIVPPERELASRTGSCLMTVRKALTVLEEKRFFRKDGRSRLLNETGGKTGQNLSVAFLTTGEGFPALPTYQRLEKELQTALVGIAAKFDSIYYGWHGKAAEWPPDQLQKIPDIIIYAGAADSALYQKIRTLRNQCLLVGVDEECIGRLDCVVSLNNYQAGYLATEKLLESGALNPALITDGRAYRPFLQRTAGFMDALVDHGLTTESRFYDKGANQAEWELPAFLDRIIAHGHDGLFLFTDHNCLAVRELIRRSRSIPEEFHLITLAAAGFNRQSHQPISAISHALPGIARRIAEIATAYSRGERFEKINLIDAEYEPGTTL